MEDGSYMPQEDRHATQVDTARDRSALPSVPLYRCKVTAIHNPNHSPPTDDTLATVYVDVSCPNPDDDWGWGGIGIFF